MSGILPRPLKECGVDGRKKKINVGVKKKGCRIINSLIQIVGKYTLNTLKFVPNFFELTLSYCQFCACYINTTEEDSSFYNTNRPPKAPIAPNHKYFHLLKHLFITSKSSFF